MYDSCVSRCEDARCVPCMETQRETNRKQRRDSVEDDEREEKEVKEENWHLRPSS